jgi:hypothetical protein
VSDAWQSAKIKHFEHVVVGPSIALLRVTGKAPRRTSGGDVRPTLLADDGHVVQRFAPLPSPPDDRVLRAAYSVPAEVIKADTVFSLEFDDGSVISLPAPTPGTARITSEDEGEPAADSGVTADSPAADDTGPEPDDSSTFPRVAEGGHDDPRSVRRQTPPPPGQRPRERRSEMAAKLTELSAALAESRHAAAELQTARERADAKAAEARADADALHQRIADLEAMNAEAQHRVLRVTAEADIAVASRVAEARVQAEQAAAGPRAELEARLADLADTARVYETQTESLTREVETLRQARAESDHALQDALESIRTLTSERDELDTWRGELERRLADTTTELAEARGQLGENEGENENELRVMRDRLADAEARAELATLQAAQAAERTAPDPDSSAPDSDSSARIRQLEAQRVELSQRAQRLAALLAPANQLAELARALTDARADAQELEAFAGVGAEVPGHRVPEAGATETTEAAEDGETAMAERAADATAATDEIEAISRRAEAEAEQQAARELAEAAAQARSPH